MHCNVIAYMYSSFFELESSLDAAVQCFHTI